MAIYAVQTTVPHEGDAEEVSTLSKQQVTYLLANQCPGVMWMAYARLGPADFIDIFEAPDEAVATKAAVLVRSNGHGVLETSIKIPWYRGLRQAKVEVIS